MRQETIIMVNLSKCRIELDEILPKVWLLVHLLGQVNLWESVLRVEVFRSALQ